MIIVLRAPHKPNLPTTILPAKIPWLKLSGEFPMDMRIPPLRIKTLLESNPLKSTILVRTSAVRPLTWSLSPGSRVRSLCGRIYTRNWLGWLETRLAQNTLNCINIVLITLTNIIYKMQVQDWQGKGSGTSFGAPLKDVLVLPVCKDMSVEVQRLRIADHFACLSIPCSAGLRTLRRAAAAADGAGRAARGVGAHVCIYVCMYLSIYPSIYFSLSLSLSLYTLYIYIYMLQLSVHSCVHYHFAQLVSTPVLM